MMKIAIVTGASSGLGTEFVKTISQKYAALDELWIIARRMDRLEKLAETISAIKIKPIALDLSKNEAYAELERILAAEKPEIQILINNAGVEKYGRFEEMSTTDISAMIDLNIKGATMVNRLCLPYMKKGSFAVMTCSVSSFVPVPGQAVYSASKIYVRFLGRALREEMKKKGVNICLLCPGNMDTEMNPKNAPNTDAVSKLPYLDMKKLTKAVLKKAKNGKALYTPGAFYRFYRTASKIFPSAFMIKFSGAYYNQ